jgi:hypothetical protein
VDITAGDAIAANDNDAVNAVVPPSLTKDEDTYVGALVTFEGACVGLTVTRPLGSLATRGGILYFFYGGDAAAVPEGELGDPSQRIEAAHLKQLSSRHQVKLLQVKKYLCVHMRTHILADGPTPKKTHTK